MSSFSFYWCLKLDKSWFLYLVRYTYRPRKCFAASKYFACLQVIDHGQWKCCWTLNWMKSDPVFDLSICLHARISLSLSHCSWMCVCVIRICLNKSFITHFHFVATKKHRKESTPFCFSHRTAQRQFYLIAVQFRLIQCMLI